ADRLFKTCQDVHQVVYASPRSLIGSAAYGDEHFCSLSRIPDRKSDRLIEEPDNQRSFTLVVGIHAARS
ncbi:MAG: hypothetical protein ABWX96_18280, partial [Propionibacteriaceae bacterium]